MKKSLFIILLVLLFQACRSGSTDKGVDPYYTKVSWGEGRPRIPLIKPLAIYKDRMTPYKWGIAYRDVINDDQAFSFNHHVEIDSITHVGIDRSYVYGPVFERKFTIEEFGGGNDYVYADQYGGLSLSKLKIEPLDSEVQIFPIDTVKKIFIYPQRWFVINVADSSVEAFFSETKYKAYLAELGCPDTLYDIDECYKQFRQTNVLPWFPDSIKNNIRN